MFIQGDTANGDPGEYRDALDIGMEQTKNTMLLQSKHNPYSTKSAELLAGTQQPQSSKIFSKPNMGRIGQQALSNTGLQKNFTPGHQIPEQTGDNFSFKNSATERENHNSYMPTQAENPNMPLQKGRDINIQRSKPSILVASNIMKQSKGPSFQSKSGR